MTLQALVPNQNKKICKLLLPHEFIIWVRSGGRWLYSLCRFGNILVDGGGSGSRCGCLVNALLHECHAKPNPRLDVFKIVSGVVLTKFDRRTSSRLQIRKVEFVVPTAGIHQFEEVIFRLALKDLSFYCFITLVNSFSITLTSA